MRSIAEMIHRESDARRKKIYRRAAELANTYLHDCQQAGVELCHDDQDAIWSAALQVGQIEYAYGPRPDFTVIRKLAAG